MRDMTDVPGPIHTLAAALALALALSGPATALAQPTGSAAETGQSEQPDDPASPDIDNRNADPREGSPEVAGESTASEEGVVLSPFDYEASESISEDASVSFPVDI